MPSETWEHILHHELILMALIMLLSIVCHTLFTAGLAEKKSPPGLYPCSIHRAGILLESPLPPITGPGFSDPHVIRPANPMKFRHG
jgi:hypothetical protein